MNPQNEEGPTIIKNSNPYPILIEKNICKVIFEEKVIGRGFFAIIHSFSIKYIPILIISNDIQEEDYCLTDREIIISLKNKKVNIMINSNRVIYKEKKYGITIIEIKEYDGFDIKDFLEIDNNILLKNVHNYSKYKICLPGDSLENENKIKLYDGTINNINLENYEINYSITNGEAFIGSPILKKDDMKVIGIQTGRKNRIGLFFKEIIQEFYNKTIIIEDTNYKSITIIYRIDDNKNIKIFGGNFVNKNRQCRIIINKKEQEICKLIDITKFGYKPKINKFLEVKLKNLDGVEDFFCMFYECKLLYSLPDISELNTKNFMSFRSMFNGCRSLEWLPDVLNWDTSNVIDMSFMFKGCTSLKKLPDISNWNTNNVEKMASLFEECSSLKSLPDISKWNTQKTQKINFLFNFCKELISLPDISKWKTDNIVDMTAIFGLCEKLKELPDISKWNTNKVEMMHQMFEYCFSLTILPDISNWDTSNVLNMMKMFNKCHSLKQLPDLSIWNINKVTDISEMFSGCTSLTCLPDISKWNTSNIYNMNSLFSGCSSLIMLPDISKWDMCNVVNISSFFCKCSSLSTLPDISKWYVKNVKNMSFMFKECSSLKHIPNISKWSLNKNVLLKEMFKSCISLVDIPENFKEKN